MTKSYTSAGLSKGLSEILARKLRDLDDDASIKTVTINGTTDQIVVTIDAADEVTISIDDDYLPNSIGGVGGEIDVTDGADGTIDVGIFRIEDYDIVGPIYAGYLANSGAYYIEKLEQDTGVLTYSSGSSDYSAAWAARAAQTYQAWDDEF